MKPISQKEEMLKWLSLNQHLLLINLDILSETENYQIVTVNRLPTQLLFKNYQLIKTYKFIKQKTLESSYTRRIWLTDIQQSLGNHTNPKWLSISWMLLGFSNQDWCSRQPHPLQSSTCHKRFFSSSRHRLWWTLCSSYTLWNSSSSFCSYNYKQLGI